MEEIKNRDVFCSSIAYARFIMHVVCYLLISQGEKSVPWFILTKVFDFSNKCSQVLSYFQWSKRTITD